VDPEVLLTLLRARIRIADPGRTIRLAVQSAGSGTAWLWFHAEELAQGRRIGQPVNLAVEAALSPRRTLDELADDIAQAVLARFAR
jgi:hypothetical protein